jgi:hypothetical protein
VRREDSRNLGDLRDDVSLEVRLRGQIARTGADFSQFSEMSDKRETGWWSAVNSNPRATSGYSEINAIPLAGPIGARLSRPPLASDEALPEACLHIS